MARKKKNKELAAVLSFIYPGIGQIYCGHFFWAIIWIVFTTGIWVTATLFGFLLHIFAAIQAYKQAARRNR